MIIQADFDIKEFLEKRGFKNVDKSQECLAVRGNVAIYYWSDSELTSTRQLTMFVVRDGETIYKGLTPMNEILLDGLLDALLPSNELISKIESYILECQDRCFGFDEKRQKKAIN